MNILITGASGGLGFALAEIYSDPKNTLFLTGRNQERLDKVTQSCENLGAKVIATTIDIKDAGAVQEWIDQIGKDFSLDLVIANAGISAGTSEGSESEKQIKEIFSTNIDGVLNTINPSIRIMEKQKSGQIALISSLAGFRGLPSSPSYSASKSCVRVYGESIRGSLAPLGIRVNVVCPGYIKTPMTDANEFPMPFLMDATKAAKIIKKGLEKNRSRIAFPFPLYFVVWLATLISTSITDPIFARLPKKKSL
ncbi:MAG: short-subunit dehydrogenase [Myxococcota bacterium]|jgi:short-subunit dehydrogenase